MYDVPDETDVVRSVRRQCQKPHPAQNPDFVPFRGLCVGFAPMNSDRALSRTFAVGTRYQCTLTLPLSSGVQSIVAEWEPDVPAKLNDAELTDYRAGRDALIAEAAAVLGGKALVIE